MKIHKEGHRILSYLFLILIIVNVVVASQFKPPSIVIVLLLSLSFLLFLLVLQFFRNPSIKVTRDINKMLAPADGKVVVIEKTTTDEFFKEERMQVSIFMSPLNVHVNRNPVSGIVKYFKYHPGKYLVAWHPKSSTLNERTTIVYEMDDGALLLIRQIAGAMARRIKCYLGEGEQVSQGDEFGFIKFGSRVDVFIPLSWNVKVTIGDKVQAGSTVLAQLNS